MKTRHIWMLLPLLALLFAACNPSKDSNDLNVPNNTAEAISQAFQITQEQVDNQNTNRITFSTNGAYYVHLKDQAGTILATGRSGKATLPYYGNDDAKVTPTAATCLATAAGSPTTHPDGGA